MTGDFYENVRCGDQFQAVGPGRWADATEDQASRLSQAADEADRRARDPDDMARQERGFQVEIKVWRDHDLRTYPEYPMTLLNIS